MNYRPPIPVWQSEEQVERLRTCTQIYRNAENVFVAIALGAIIALSAYTVYGWLCL